MGVSYNQLLLPPVGQINGTSQININFWRLKTNDR